MVRGIFMKKTPILLLVLLFLAGNLHAQCCGDVVFDSGVSGCLPTAVCAYDYCLDECGWQPCCDGPNRFYLGPVFFLRRDDFTVDTCTENNVFGISNHGRVRGQFVGVNGGYEFRQICCFYFRLDGLFTGGSLKKCPHINLYDWQVEGRLGWTWGECLPCGWAFTPYVGAGYLEQNRRLKHHDFRSRYHTWYVPLGIYADAELMYGFSAGVDFTFAPFVDTDVNALHRDFTFGKNHNSKNRYMWRVSVPVRWQVTICSGFELSVEPFWEQIHFGRVCALTNPAGVVTASGIPQFREDFWGAKFLAGYRF